MSTTKNKQSGLVIVFCIKSDHPGFHAYCPGLPDVHTYGITKEEALTNIQDAIIAYIKSLVKHGDPIPPTLFQTPSEQLKSQAPKSKCISSESVIQRWELVPA